MSLPTHLPESRQPLSVDSRRCVFWQYRKSHYQLPVTLRVSESVPELSLRRDASEESPCHDETLHWILVVLHLLGLTRSG